MSYQVPYALLYFVVNSRHRGSHKTLCSVTVVQTQVSIIGHIGSRKTLCPRSVMLRVKELKLQKSDMSPAAWRERQVY